MVKKGGWEMNQAMRRPDIEFTKTKDGRCHSYGHIYFKPFIVHLLGKTIIGKKHLKQTIKKEMGL